MKGEMSEPLLMESKHRWLPPPTAENSRRISCRSRGLTQLGRGVNIKSERPFKKLEDEPGLIHKVHSNSLKCRTCSSQEVVSVMNL